MGNGITRRSGAWALLSIMLFTVICSLMQFLRTDLDWVRVPLSFYLIGPKAAWVRGAYVLLGIALPVLGWGWHRALVPAARSMAPVLLLALAGVALCVTAFATTNTYAHPATLHGFVHGVAAQTAFLASTVAMLLLAWRLRGDGRWKRLHPLAFGWAGLCFAGLWVQALWRALPRGASQKLLIVLLLGWLGWMAWQLWRNPNEVPQATD